MRTRPITLRAANAYVEEHHRHSKPVRGHKFSVAAVDEAGELVGVAIVGRPVARGLDDGVTAEVLRVCTTGEPNACSFLYGASWRVCRAMGYDRMITYTLAVEPGISLRAAGAREVARLPVRKGWETPAYSHLNRDNEEYLSSERVRWEWITR